MAMVQEPVGVTGSAPVARTSGERRFWRGWVIVLLQILVGVAAITIWYLIGKFQLISTFYISSPENVYKALVRMISSGELGYNYWDTMQAALLSFVIGGGAGIVAGLVLAILPRVEQVLQPYISALYSLPRIALAPIFILFFGIGLQAKVATGVSLSFFILLVTARAGVMSVNEDILTITQVLGATKFDRFRKVLLPVAMPAIFGGLRLGLIYSLLGVVTSEIIASKAGLGQLIISYSGTFDMSSVYALLIVLAVTAALLNYLLGRLERWILRYQPPQSR